MFFGAKTFTNVMWCPLNTGVFFTLNYFSKSMILGLECNQHITELAQIVQEFEIFVLLTFLENFKLYENVCNVVANWFVQFWGLSLPWNHFKTVQAGHKTTQHCKTLALWLLWRPFWVFFYQADFFWKVLYLSSNTNVTNVKFKWMIWIWKCNVNLRLLSIISGELYNYWKKLWELYFPLPLEIKPSTWNNNAKHQQNFRTGSFHF